MNLKMKALFAALFLCLGAGWGQTRPAATEPSSVTARTITEGPPTGYAGVDMCRNCHPAQFAQFSKTAHATLKAHKDAAVACETCHGPGGAHVDAQR